MNLEENDVSSKSINKDKDTIILNFMTMDEKVICSYKYPLETKFNKVVEDFLKKNNEESLKSFFDLGANFSIHNLNFYSKKDEKFEKIHISNIKSLKKDSLEDTIALLGMNYFGSINTSAMTNNNFFKIYVKYEIKYKNIVANFEKYIINNTRFVGKPKLNKKNYYLYDKFSKELKIILLNQEDINKTKINSFSILDTYCNAKNNLFIYEGITISNIQFSRFFKINLDENKLTLISSKFPKRILHSMIFIPSSYIFIIGGKGSKEVLIYEIEDKNADINNNDNNNNDNILYDKYPYLLPKELLEPSLISIDNKYIYIIENSTILLNIYRFNVLSLSPFEQIELKENVYMNQKFFGVVKNKNSILFLGGQKINMNFNSNENNSDKNYCFEYHYDINTITESKIKFLSMNFIEKTFIPIKDDMYIQLAEYKKNGNKDAIKIMQINRKEKDVINSELIK